MLKRKSESEIANIKKKRELESKNLIFPLKIGAGAATFVGLLLYLFGGKFVKPLETDLVKLGFMMLLVFSVVSASIYLAQRSAKTSFSDESLGYVCPKCLESREDEQCEKCGSNTESRRYYEYKSS